MNDVTYVEAARMLGERMMLDGGKSPSDRIRYAFRLSLGRPPEQKELDILTSGYDRHLSFYRANPNDADALTKVGESPRNTTLDVPQLATCSIVAGLILNLDEAVTRE